MPEIFGPSQFDPVNKTANTQRLFNLFREPIGQRKLLRSCVGLTQRAATGQFFCRDLFDLDGKLFSVFGRNLYRISGATVTLIGDVGTGHVQLSRNAERLTVTAGGRYFVWDGEALTEPATGAFSAFGSVDYLAGRTILTELNGSRIQWSGIDDPSTLDGLNFAAAESRPDKVLRVIVSGSAMMLFGEQSTEIWGATGQGGANAFALLPGAVVDTGLFAFGTATRIDGGVFLVGDDGIAYIAAGTTWQPVSTPAVNAAIAAHGPTRCKYWEDSGHKFCAIGFADRPDWVYDITTQEWHERGEGVDGAWRATAAVRSGGAWYFGADDGALYSGARNGMDAGAPLIRQATSGVIERGGDYFGLSQVLFGASYGEQVMDRAASLVLEISRDGATWGEPRACDVGFNGDFSKRAVFRALGRSRRFALRLTFSDPCDFSLWADAEVKLV